MGNSPEHYLKTQKGISNPGGYIGVILNEDLYRATLGILLPPLIAGSLLSPLQIPCPFLPSLRCAPVCNDYVKLMLYSEDIMLTWI